ncbi:sensor histidine kinase [Streptococcus pantholopis]|uniref:histidine kinase n=1 Tax=Streptococcus pantholopis TaxID=1811193 RepID=A0A172Q7A8_9STRE|nr:sensor histidine kinase [Streptococcus pantholopis]AND79348.1 histidine kinase [Streptococcus pantholopis]
MIWKFFKEYRLWYSLYAIMSALYFLMFYLYRLPLSYFINSLILNLTLLILVTIWQYHKFKQKLNILHHFIYVEELKELRSPSERSYQDLIAKLKDKESEESFAAKAEMEEWQSLIKMWSHQMKVPISALSLMAQTDHLESNEVQQQLMKLQNYLDSLLTYMKFSQNKDDFRFEEVSVSSLIREIIKKYRITFLAKNLSVTIQGDWLLKTDKKWLSFALSQVLDNAIKYSKNNGSIDILITDSSITVADKGIGILDEDLPRLFEEGFTGYNGHKHQKATGLGLYMTKKILENLNLTIEISSQIDKGTDVIISKTTKDNDDKP